MPLVLFQTGLQAGFDLVASSPLAFLLFSYCSTTNNQPDTHFCVRNNLLNDDERASRRYVSVSSPYRRSHQRMTQRRHFQPVGYLPSGTNYPVGSNRPACLNLSCVTLFLDQSSKGSQKPWRRYPRPLPPHFTLLRQKGRHCKSYDGRVCRFELNERSQYSI